MRRIGVLIASAESDPERQKDVKAFQEALQDLGWIDGRNIQIDIRWAPNRSRCSNSRRTSSRCSQMSFLRQPRPPRRHFSKGATIPTIFAVSNDPVGSGFVQSFPRPGGNVTGFINMEPTMAGKRLELLKQIAPHVNRVAFCSTRQPRHTSNIT